MEMLWAVAAVSTNNVWVTSSEGIRHWNGTNWTTFYFPLNLDRIDAISANDIWVVGSWNDKETRVLHWDGNVWSVIPSPNPGAHVNVLSDVAAVSACDVWTVGSYANNSLGPSQTLILHGANKANKPELISPRSGGTVRQKPGVLLSWKSAKCANWYNVMVRQDSRNGHIVDQASYLTTTQYTTKTLAPFKTYFWRVEACNALGCQASAWWKFW